MARIDPQAAAKPQEALRLSRVFSATREAVFRALTDPKALSQWFGPPGVQCRKVEVDMRPGGHYSLEMYEPDGVYPLSGTYREVEAPTRLVMTWIWGHGELAGIESLVTIELREAAGGTELVLIHEDLPTTAAQEKHQGGWIACFDSLDAYLSS